MASTVLPNGIIIPEKFSRDWYADLYHNWEELDNLLGGGTPKDGTLTIQKNGTTVGTFSANQATNETVNIEVPDVNDATLTIQQNGTTVDSFTANSSTDKTVNISVPTKTSDLNNDSGFITGVSWNDVADKPSFATVATSGSYNDLSNKPTIPTVNNATLTIQRNGTTVDTFTANASVDKTINISTADDTKISLAGSNAISGSLIPATDNSIDIGSSTKNLKMLYTKGITIDGTQFLPSDYIPRKGGPVLSGSLFTKPVDDSYLAITGGTYSNTGASIWLYGKDMSSKEKGKFWIGASNKTSTSWLVGTPDGSLTWSGQPIQYGSDQRLKQQIAEIDDKLLDAWEDVNLVQFKYNDAVDKKGTKARLHTGYVVQQIDNACKKHGVDVSEYGLYCHEEYPQETEEVEVEQKDGTKTKERKVIREASEHYSLRYTEALIVECKYLRRCIARLTARIEELEKGNNTK